MPLETAVYISDLVITNPPTSDLETQGANHLQLIKTVLQNVFGTVTRRYVGLPFAAAFSGSSFGASLQSGSGVLLLNTSGGAATVSLPTLGAADAGWEMSIIKTTTDLNPYFIVPPSGTIQSGEYTGLTKCRRCIPGRRTRVLWTGSSFIAERVENRPIGTVFDSMFGTLPVGYEWANGQTLSSAANYPEFFALNGNAGTTPDMRNRAAFGLDNPGGTGTSGRITVAGGNFDGTVINGFGGSQNHALVAAELPTITPTFTGTLISLGTLSINQNPVRAGNDVAGNSYGGGSVSEQAINLTVTIPNFTPAGSISSFGGNAAHTIMPPAGILAKILVVE